MARRVPVSPWFWLSDELKVIVMSYLDDQCLVDVSVVCSDWHRISTDVWHARRSLGSLAPLLWRSCPAKPGRKTLKRRLALLHETAHNVKVNAKAVKEQKPDVFARHSSQIVGILAVHDAVVTLAMDGKLRSFNVDSLTAVAVSTEYHKEQPIALLRDDPQRVNWRETSRLAISVDAEHALVWRVPQLDLIAEVDHHAVVDARMMPGSDRLVATWSSTEAKFWDLGLAPSRRGSRNRSGSSRSSRDTARQRHRRRLLRAKHAASSSTDGVRMLLAYSIPTDGEQHQEVINETSGNNDADNNVILTAAFSGKRTFVVATCKFIDVLASNVDKTRMAFPTEPAGKPLAAELHGSLVTVMMHMSTDELGIVHWSVSPPQLEPVSVIPDLARIHGKPRFIAYDEADDGRVWWFKSSGGVHVCSFIDSLFPSKLDLSHGVRRVDDASLTPWEPSAPAERVWWQQQRAHPLNSESSVVVTPTFAVAVARVGRGFTLPHLPSDAELGGPIDPLGEEQSMVCATVSAPYVLTAGGPDMCIQRWDLMAKPSALPWSLKPVSKAYHAAWSFMNSRGGVSWCITILSVLSYTLWNIRVSLASWQVPYLVMLTPYLLALVLAALSLWARARTNSLYRDPLESITDTVRTILVTYPFTGMLVAAAAKSDGWIPAASWTRLFVPFPLLLLFTVWKTVRRRFSDMPVRSDDRLLRAGNVLGLLGIATWSVLLPLSYDLHDDGVAIAAFACALAAYLLCTATYVVLILCASFRHHLPSFWLLRLLGLAPADPAAISRRANRLARVRAVHHAVTMTVIHAPILLLFLRLIIHIDAITIPIVMIPLDILPVVFLLIGFHSHAVAVSSDDSDSEF